MTAAPELGLIALPCAAASWLDMAQKTSVFLSCRSGHVACSTRRP
jgi:hypothetical protein